MDSFIIRVISIEKRDEEEENTSLQDDLIKIDKEDNKKTNDVHSLQIVLTIHNNSFL